ncbi:MAG: NTP transferase domain-containing protein [Duncaniella sp.]|nr:NTP transferase domain-containing protein [Duncaniella sp.]
MNYVILAAGLGSRFSKEGIDTPKPLVPLMGQPMIGRLIRVLIARGGCEEIHIVANPRMEGFVEYLEELKAQGAPLVIKPYMSDNSYSSLRVGAEGIDGKFIAMTVDAIFPNSEFEQFKEVVERMPDDEVCMALTRFIDDESPLYARLAPSGTEVIDYRYGGEPYAEGAIVSAGIYGLTPEAMKVVAARGQEGYPESLSDFQRILAAETPLKVVVFEMTKALDVDCSHDRAAAEAFLRAANGEI